MKRPTRVTRGSSLVTSLAAAGVGHVGVHRAEFVDLDQLVVEAVALLLEQHRAAAVELDGERDQRHDRQRAEQQRGRRRSCRTAISSRRPSRRSAGRTRRAPARCRCRNRSAGGSAACWCARRAGCRPAAPTASSASAGCGFRPRSAARRSRDRRACGGRIRRDRRPCRACAGRRVGARAVVAAVVEQADDLDAGVLLPAQLLDHARRRARRRRR